MGQRYTFVTVSHAADYGQLKLHARSMGMFCPASLVNELLIVENFDDGAVIDWRQDLLEEYGSLAHAVRFIAASDIAEMPLSTGGWWRQQVCKIAVSRTVSSERYVVLDSKNLLMRGLSLDFLESASGKPRLNCSSFERHPLRDALIHTLAYLGMDATPFIPHFARTSTPYTMLTSVARQIVETLEAQEGKPFGQVFLDNKLTEFFLYSGFLAKKGTLWCTYDMTQPRCAQIWGHEAKNENLAQNVAQRGIAPDGCPFIAVHRRALIDFDVIPRVIIAEALKERGLFATVEDAVRFSLNPNAWRIAKLLFRRKSSSGMATP